MICNSCFEEAAAWSSGKCWLCAAQGPPEVRIKTEIKSSLLAIVIYLGWGAASADEFLANFVPHPKMLNIAIVLVCTLLFPFSNFMMIKNLREVFALRRKYELAIVRKVHES